MTYILRYPENNNKSTERPYSEEIAIAFAKRESKNEVVDVYKLEGRHGYEIRYTSFLQGLEISSKERDAHLNSNEPPEALEAPEPKEKWNEHMFSLEEGYYLKVKGVYPM